MKINEVERLVGITKKNIRYYEEMGLLRPERNSENGYREYGEADVETLRCVKLLRKLDLPIEEIRRIQTGEQTLCEGLRRQKSALDRSRENLVRMSALCERIAEDGCRLEELDSGRYLDEIERMERDGTQFADVEQRDQRRRAVREAAIGAAVFAVLMIALSVLLLWGLRRSGIAVWLTVLIAALPAVFVVGVGCALLLRVREIGKGEEDAARQY